MVVTDPGSIRHGSISTRVNPRSRLPSVVGSEHRDVSLSVWLSLVPDRRASQRQSSLVDFTTAAGAP